ncbi:hypothetical protein HL42_7974 [Trichophyton rubrum]|nr:hypothetical protein HL42_7974 [Trichophyton rubrum]
MYTTDKLACDILEMIPLGIFSDSPLVRLSAHEGFNSTPDPGLHGELVVLSISLISSAESAAANSDAN